MKRAVIALASVGLLYSSFTKQAIAQSVTVFGVLDLAATSVKNERVGTIRSLASGANSTSRWGIRGTEQLGSGLSAGFWLESTVVGDTGVAGGNSTVTSPAGQFFDRRSTVSLSSATVGELRLGRDYVPTFSAFVGFDPFSYVGIAASGSLASQSVATALNRAFGASANANPIVRANNAVQYVLPSNLNGLNGSLWVSAGEGSTVAAGATKAQGGRIGYAAGPMTASAALLVTKNLASDDFKDVVVGASYDFGVAKVSLAQRRFSYLSSKLAKTLLAVTAPIGPGTFKLSYGEIDQAGTNATGVSIDANDASLLGVGYVYDLSKRTALYGTAARIANKGAATFAVSGGPAGIPGGGNSTGYQIGLRHSF